MDRDEIREADYDIIENAKVAFRVVWKNAILIILISLIGALAAMIVVGVVGRVTNYDTNATVFRFVIGTC